MDPLWVDRCVRSHRFVERCIDTAMVMIAVVRSIQFSVPRLSSFQTGSFALKLVVEDRHHNHPGVVVNGAQSSPSKPRAIIAPAPHRISRPLIIPASHRQSFSNRPRASLRASYRHRWG